MRKEKKGEGIYNVIIIGAGTAGLVTAAGTAGLGGRVALIERNLMGGDCLNFGCVPSKALISSARFVGQFMQKRFEAEGITVQHCTEATRVSMRDGLITLEGNYKPPGAAQGSPVQFTGHALLLAVGRCPMMKALNLETAGVKYSSNGVEVNDYLQTSQPHIYAAGDIANRLKFTHTADFTARIVVRNILMAFQFLRQKVDWSVVPWCTYTDPEVAHVGLGEKEAKQRDSAYDLFVVPLEEVDRALSKAKMQVSRRS